MTEERRKQRDRRTQPRRKGERRVTAGSKLDLILDVTRRLMSITDLDALLRDMATVTTQLLDADRATIFIVDRDRAEVWSKVALGTGAGEIRQPIGVGIAGTVAATGETINIADAYEDPRFNPEPDHRTGYRTKTLLTFPMTGQNGRVIGVFQVVNKNGGGEFTTDDEETLSSLGASAAVAVENAQLIAEQRRLWTTLIETLAVTIDARDQQTAGHSQRVTRYAEVIGRALGLQGIELEKIRAAALLHDYGKIAVRDQFLLKPGKLDQAEFEYMKVHAEKTGEFLAHLVFPQDMRDVPVIAAQHHERMDGKGYPRGLPAERILLGARIVAAAD
ncbi:MAG TPA: HD domain-containing phosphohydrolase, partial [Candidatus Limnocylindria bacterium]|nr:HD domain-containing phosphohydrolase [Candidatus Limnocylindria bacterium]